MDAAFPDSVAARRRRLAFPPPPQSVPLLTLVAAGDLLPLAGIVLFWLVKDNTGGLVTAAMWIFFAYLLLTLPRMAYYAVRAFGKGRATRILAPIAALGMAGVLIHGAVSGRSTLAVHRVTLRSDRLPEAFDGLRIAQFTDLHIGTLVDPDREMRALVDSLNALRPDLVIFCGDLVNIRCTELDSTAMRLLGGIRSRYGTFSITGNHDTGNYVRDTLSLPPATNIAALVERQRAMGWRVLDNETVYLRRGDDSIALSGISYDRSLARQRHDRTLPGYDFGTTYRDVPQDLYNITAAFIWLKRKKCCSQDFLGDNLTTLSLEFDEKRVYIYDVRKFGFDGRCFKKWHWKQFLP